MGLGSWREGQFGTQYITKEVTAAGVVLRVRGDFGIAESAIFTQEIESVVRERPQAWVIVDISEVGFCNVHGVRAMVVALRRVRASGGELTLRGVQGRWWRLLRRTGLSGYFPMG